MADIRPMTFAEFRQLISWADAEGWNPGIHDAERIWAIDPEGFLCVCEASVVVGGGAIIRHSERFGFMGLFIIAPPYRSQGLGAQLWLARRDRLIARLAPGATIGLDGVDSMVSFYERGGFKKFTRHRRFQMDGTAAFNRILPGVSDLRGVQISEVCQLDSRCFPAPRASFLNSWIRQPEAVALGVVDGDHLQGFGVMRRCVLGWKIGPLFSKSASVADRILQSCFAASAGQPVFIDAPENNSQAIALCHQYSMTEVFGCERMYLGSPPELDHDCIFGVTTLESG